MTIEWYPGHMGKAMEKMAELVKRMDVIIEILDARLPVSSSNHLISELRRNKPLIKVMNKNDLADPVVTRNWVRFFERQHGVRALPLSARVHREVMQLPKLCLRLAPSRGKPGRPLRAMVVGIPNVGKSTLINTLAGKSIAKVGDKPAITTGVQQIDLHNGIILYDTPGVLWPVMSDQGAAYRLAVSGAIGAGAMDCHVVGLFAGEYLLRRYRQQLLERYRLTEAPESPHDLLEQAGRRLGCLIAGGGIDMQRASEALLRELRGGKLGRISLEEPEEEARVTAEATEERSGGDEVPVSS